MKKTKLKVRIFIYNMSIFPALSEHAWMWEEVSSTEKKNCILSALTHDNYLLDKQRRKKKRKIIRICAQFTYLSGIFTESAIEFIFFFSRCWFRPPFVCAHRGEIWRISAVWETNNAAWRTTNLINDFLFVCSYEWSEIIHFENNPEPPYFISVLLYFLFHFLCVCVLCVV